MLVTLLKVGRSIVAERQPLINDARKAHKGFTGEQMGREVMERFRAQTHIDLAQPTHDAYQDLLLAMVQAEREVIADAQLVINRPGIGFKGFVPSVFARKVGEKIFAKTGVTLKLTGMSCRLPGHHPDDFEAEVLRMFADPRHPKGQQYAKATIVNGKPAVRVLNPDYADADCLTCLCNEGPMSGWNMAGMKAGWNEGALVGAISIVMPMR